MIPQVLEESQFNVALKQFVDKDDKDAIPDGYHAALEQRTREVLKELGDAFASVGQIEGALKKVAARRRAGGGVPVDQPLTTDANNDDDSEKTEEESQPALLTRTAIKREMATKSQKSNKRVKTESKPKPQVINLDDDDDEDDNSTIVPKREVSRR